MAKGTDKPPRPRRTGPHSEAGKAVSRLNALKHGLTAELVAGPDRAEIDRLATLFAGRTADENRRRVAVIAAEAQLAVRRIEDAKRVLVNIELAARSDDNQAPAIIAAADVLRRLHRAEARARKRRREALQFL